MDTKYWYAVQTEDYMEWDIGSFDLKEAIEMANERKAMQIAVIDADYDEDGNPTTDPFCVDVIASEDFEDYL